MSETAPGSPRLSGLSHLKLFCALSRTPHGLLDMTAPAFAALLWLGHFPPLPVIFLGLVTVFAGYSAVYALNDMVDYRIDRHRLTQEVFRPRNGTEDIDAAFVRHPVAQGFLSYFEGLGWTICWSAVAVTGAYLLNPVCVLFFVAGCILEAVYCRMLKISPLRSAVNGIVKTLGALAAVFAVDPRPSFLYLFTLFVTLFLWEIGGQNVPNDCSDVEEDRKLEARTVPVSFGLDFSAYTSGVTLIGAFLLSFVLLSLSGASFPWPYYMGLLFFGVNLLLIPAYRFSRSPDCSHAMILFNKASLYPAALFAVVLTGILFR